MKKASHKEAIKQEIYNLTNQISEEKAEVDQYIDCMHSSMTEVSASNEKILEA